MATRFSLCERRQLELAVAGRLSAADSDRLSDHLQHCPHCQDELESLAGSREWWQDAHSFLSSTDELVAVDDEEPEPLRLDFLSASEHAGSLGRLGGYEVEAIVGRGGMGVVLRAQDPALNRHVAIKVLAGHLAASAAARKRFAREAKAAAAVMHDNVIPIHTVDTDGDTPFLVMPYISGRSLQERLDAEGHLEVAEALRIAMQTARGLAAAHAQGLVHRDIKPANILLENGVERVRITDFGLARAVDDASQTQSGFIAGTPQYMAPEQARGELIDARADLFSLGSVLYAMLSGHPPFRAETTLAVLRRICDDAPRDLREHNADVPPWLADIVNQLLAKSPAERFQSAEEVAELLEAWLAHVQQPAAVPPPVRVVATTTKPSPSRQWVVVTAAFVGIGALLLAGGIAWQLGGSAGSKSDALDRAPAHGSLTASHAGAKTTLPVARRALEDSMETELRRAGQELLQIENEFRKASSGESGLAEGLLAMEQQLDRLERELTPPARPGETK